MTTVPTTTIVDVGRPPAPVPPPTWHGVNVPHRELPHTGTDSLLLPSAGLLLAVGLLLTVVARKRHRKRYVVAQGISLPPYTVWLVLDTRHGNAVHSEWRTKDAAKNRAAVLNANIPSLADSKGWKA